MAEEVIGGPYSGKHQQLRRNQRSRSHDDLTVGVSGPFGSPLVDKCNSDGGTIIQLDPPGSGMEFDAQIGISLKWSNESISGAAAPSAPVHELIEADAALLWTIEIRVEWFSESLDALHKPS